MDICSDGHDEVCYVGRGCPCCLLLEEIDNARKALSVSNLAYDDLKYQRDELKDLLEEFNPEALV